MKIQLRGLSKAYRQNNILNNINLLIETNTTFCLLGKNGAGKSTLLNLISNIIEPSEGEVCINDMSYSDCEIAIKKLIGVQSEFDQIIGELDAIDYLQWIGMLYGMNKTDLLKRIENLLKYFFDNDDALLKLTKNYSSGMRKKLSICAAVLHKPDLLILDEPCQGLDEQQVTDFVALVDELCSQSNKTLIYVSHYENEIPRCVDKVMLLENNAHKQYSINITKSTAIAV